MPLLPKVAYLEAKNTQQSLYQLKGVKGTFVLVVVTTTVITVLCMPGSSYWSLVGNKQARNRWLVAYTLLRNPSLQELTASRIEEKKPQEVVATGETDPGLEAESSDIKQPLWSTVKEANFEVTS